MSSFLAITGSILSFRDESLIGRSDSLVSSVWIPAFMLRSYQH